VADLELAATGVSGSVSGGTIAQTRAVGLSGWFGSQPAGNTYWAASPSLADVQTAINLTSPGDTVRVPAGSGWATWASELDIRWGILLLGPGYGNLTIKRGGSYLIDYYPSNYNLNSPFRLAGFTLDGNGGDIMYLGQDGTPEAPYTAQTKIRIDHNRFYSSVSVSESYNAMIYRGALYGSVDNNIFDSYSEMFRNINTGYGDDWYDAYATAGFAWGLGNQYKLYFEDNTFNFGTVWSQNLMTNSQYSGRYAFRYNTINLAKDAWPLFDVHGVQDDSISMGMYSSFGAEVYGNLVAGGHQGDFFQTRGGSSVVFYNLIPDMFYCTSSSVVMCPFQYVELQMVHDTYFWQNRVSAMGALVASYNDDAGINCGGHVRPTRGTDFFDNTSTPAVTAGPLANRPVTPVVGQAYWATDQSTTDLTGMVGKNPATPIVGTLYYCKSAGSWTHSFTPYTYPHPHRSDPVLGD
jgi:hypothetical protein